MPEHVESEAQTAQLEGRVRKTMGPVCSLEANRIRALCYPYRSRHPSYGRGTSQQRKSPEIGVLLVGNWAIQIKALRHEVVRVVPDCRVAVDVVHRHDYVLPFWHFIVTCRLKKSQSLSSHGCLPSTTPTPFLRRPVLQFSRRAVCPKPDIVPARVS